MANYTTEEEITVSAEIDLEITVQDQDGNEIECDVDGYGFSLTAQIDTQSIKDNMLDDVREEIRDELRDELKDELREEIEGELLMDIVGNENPFIALEILIAKMAVLSKPIVERRLTSISSMREKIDALNTAIDGQNQVIQKLQVRLDEGAEAKINALQTLEKAREEASQTADREFELRQQATINPQEDK